MARAAPMSMRLRLAAVLVAAATLLAAGCGFRLQGRVALSRALTSTYIESDDPQSDFVQGLRRALLGSGASLALRAADATAVLHVDRDELQERVLSVSSRNIPREYELTYLVRFGVKAGTQELLADEDVAVSRDFSFDERRLLAKEREKDMLREALARDLVGVVMRRLASLP